MLQFSSNEADKDLSEALSLMVLSFLPAQELSKVSVLSRESYLLAQDKILRKDPAPSKLWFYLFSIISEWVIFLNSDPLLGEVNLTGCQPEGYKTAAPLTLQDLLPI